MSKISIIGRGINPACHLSLSALRALKTADKILGIESEKDFWKDLQKEFDLCEVEDVSCFYKSNDKDSINYSRYVDYVISQSSNFQHLALLVAGHPLLGVSFIDLLKKKAPENLWIEIIDGISSFDVMTTYFGIDPLEQGTVLLDVNRLLLFEYKLEVYFSYFIYHICSIGNQKTNFLNPSLDNRIDILKNYLLRYYSEGKKVYFCQISSGANSESLQIESRVGELERSKEKINFATTLYIPPEQPVNLDWNYLNILRSSHEIHP